MKPKFVIVCAFIIAVGVIVYAAVGRRVPGAARDSAGTADRPSGDRSAAARGKPGG